MAEWVRTFGSYTEVYETATGRKVRTEFASGLTEFYEGERDAERKVRTVSPDGFRFFFEGERGAERKVRLESPTSTRWYFRGDRDQERLVRKELSDGYTEWYRGVKDREEKFFSLSPDGTRRWYRDRRVYCEYGRGHRARDPPGAEERVGQKRRRSDDETCAICLEDKTATLTALVPCGHSLCSACATRLGPAPCPHCRAPVAQRMRVFL